MIVTILFTLIILWNLFIVTYPVQRSHLKPGIVCKSQEYPYYVSIQIRKKGHLCGGSLLNKFWVLTAAHCKEDFQPDEMAVFAGTAPRVIELSGVEMFHLHPKFAPDGEAIKYDIALVKVTKKIERQKYANYIKLPTREIIFHVCRNCIALTVGSHGIIDPPPKEKKRGKIIIIDTVNLHLRCVPVRAFEVTLGVVTQSKLTGTKQPGTNQPGTNQPGKNQNLTNQSGATQPGTNQYLTNKPGTNQPGSNKPGINQTATNQPGTNKSVTTKPGTSQTRTTPNASNITMEVFFPFGFSVLGRKICMGDFGGPIMCKNQQIGVISRGVGCKDYKKGVTVVTNVYTFIGWINEHISKDFDNNTHVDQDDESKGGTCGRMSVVLVVGAFVILEYLKYFKYVL